MPETGFLLQPSTELQTQVLGTALDQAPVLRAGGVSKGVMVGLGVPSLKRSAPKEGQTDCLPFVSFQNVAKNTRTIWLVRGFPTSNQQRNTLKYKEMQGQAETPAKA